MNDKLAKQTQTQTQTQTGIYLTNTHNLHDTEKVIQTLNEYTYTETLDALPRKHVNVRMAPTKDVPSAVVGATYGLV